MHDFSKLNYRLCVGLMVINQKRQIFTGQRLDYPSEAWQMPQGGIEAGEDPLTAAYRELYEETSISQRDVELLAVSEDWLSYDLPNELIPRLWNGAYRGQTQKWFLMRYIGEEVNINLRTESPEFSSWRWSTKDQLIQSIVPFKMKLYENLIKEFDRYI